MEPNGEWIECPEYRHGGLCRKREREIATGTGKKYLLESEVSKVSFVQWKGRY